MPDKLAIEEDLSRNIPGEILRLIDGIERAIEPSLAEDISNSTELRKFRDSLKAPAVQEVSKVSALLEDMRIISSARHSRQRTAKHSQR